MVPDFGCNGLMCTDPKDRTCQCRGCRLNYQIEDAIREAVAAERERCAGWAAQAVRDLEGRAMELEARGDTEWAKRYWAKKATAEDIKAAIQEGVPCPTS